MSSIAVFPTPSFLELGNGDPFFLHSHTIVEATKETKSVAEMLIKYLLPALGHDLSLRERNHDEMPSTDDTCNVILMQLDPLSQGHKEGYRLQITTKKVHLAASTPHGLVHGLQTIRQLLPPQIMSHEPVVNQEWPIPCVTITDYPVFPWRGMHLDVGRHMFPVPCIKKYIDLLSFYKYNVFHWHLTEDQGWRIEIKKHPKLTQVSATREETPILASRLQGDGKRYGGFYTQEQIRDIVAYAKRRHITIVPEIELPGHTVAALAAYPELGCLGKDGGYKVRTTWGVSEEVFCAGKENVFKFLEEVLEEVLDLFPSTYIHVGGDECPKGRWKSCPHCQARKKTENLSDEFELQSWFIRRIEIWLKQRGRRLIGWDEILEGGLSPSATVMGWRGNGPGIKAANAGNDVIMTPTSHCYLDYYQSEDKEGEPPAIGGYLPLEQAYQFDLLCPEIADDKRHHILGGQCNVWTEYMPSFRQVEFMAFPRAIAVSDVLWRHPEDRVFDTFKARLEIHLRHLDESGVNYRREQQETL